MKKRIKLPFAKSPFGGFRGLIALAALLLLQSSAATAQTWQWATAAGSKNINTKADYPVDLATDANGNSYLLSKIHSKEIYVGSTSIADGLGISTSVMTMLSSLDKNGNYRWSKIIGAANTDPKEVKVIKDKVFIFGAVVTTGTYAGNYDSDYTSPSFYSSISLACYDTSSNFKWVVRPDTITEIDNTYYKPISFDVDESGNSYILTSMPPGSKIIGSSMSIPTTTPYKGYGFYVLKYNPSGALLSVTMLKDFCYARGNQGGVSNFRFTLNKLTNQYYVYGSAFAENLTDTLYIKSSMMKNALFFAAFDNDGTYKWDKRDNLNTLANTALRGAALDASGNIIISGLNKKGVTFNGYTFDNPLPSSDIAGLPFIMKMSNTGSLIWCKSGGSFGKFGTFLGSARHTMNNRFIAISGLSGQKVYFGETKDSVFVNNSGQDGWYAIVDINTGKTVKMGAARGDGFSDGMGPMSFSGDDLYVSGYFESSSFVMDSSAVSIGPAKSGTDLFVAKMSTNSLSIEDKTSNLVNIKIYPNPANDVVNIENLQEGTEVRLFSITGQQVYTGNSSANLHQIAVSGFAAGTYILQIRDKDGEQYSAKIVKQ